MKTTSGARVESEQFDTSVDLRFFVDPDQEVHVTEAYSVLESAVRAALLGVGYAPASVETVMRARV